MKKFNKGIVITSTVAAAIAAMTLAGCGSNANDIAPKATPAQANAIQVVKNDEVVKPASAEVSEEKTTETTTNTKKDSKKKSKKKKSKKTTEQAAETTQQTVQPVVVVPVEIQATAQVQPAQQAQSVQTQQAPAVVTPVSVESNITPEITVASKTEYTSNKANEVGTAGSNYYECMNYVEEQTVSELPTGWFYDGNGSGAVMNIAKNGNVYSFIVSKADGKGGYDTYSFSGKLENGRVVYTAGQQDYIIYNADGSVKSAKFVSNGHSGQIKDTNTGIVWEDSFGSNFVFVSNAM